MMIISLGNISYAAHKIASNAEAFSYNLGYGFSVAAAALVGQQLGKNARKEAEYNAKVCTFMSLLVMSAFALLFFSIPHLIISLFTKERTAKFIRFRLANCFPMSTFPRSFYGLGRCLARGRSDQNGINHYSVRNFRSSTSFDLSISQCLENRFTGSLVDYDN